MWIGLRGHLGFDRRVDKSWDSDAADKRRALFSVANDGIISSAAIIQGLLSGGATGKEALIGVTALIAIGAIAAGSTEFAESASERSHQLAIVKDETRRLELEPQEELEELTYFYEKKGLSRKLSVLVAEELFAKDALGAQLETEFDIERVLPRSEPWKVAARAFAAFLLGSIVPLILLVVIPWPARGEITLMVVLSTLAVSGWIGARSEHANPITSIIRTVTVGLIVLGVSTFAGQLVSF